MLHEAFVFAAVQAGVCRVDSTANLSFDGCRYNGHIVAKLPFEPFSLLAKLAHRGIPTPSANDCSFVSSLDHNCKAYLDLSLQGPFDEWTIHCFIPCLVNLPVSARPRVREAV